MYFFFPGETRCPDKSWKNTEVVLQKQSNSNQDFRYGRPGLKSPGTAWRRGLELLGVKPVQRSCSPPVHPGCTKAGQRAALWGCCFPLNWEKAGPLKNIILSPTACEEVSKAAGDPERHGLRGEGTMALRLCLLPLLRGQQ